MKDPSCELALTLLCQLYTAARAAGLMPDLARDEAIEQLDWFRLHVERRHAAGRYRPGSTQVRGAYPLEDWP